MDDIFTLVLMRYLFGPLRLSGPIYMTSNSLTRIQFTYVLQTVPLENIAHLQLSTPTSPRPLPYMPPNPTHPLTYSTSLILSHPMHYPPHPTTYSTQCTTQSTLPPPPTPPLTLIYLFKHAIHDITIVVKCVTENPQC